MTANKPTSSTYLWLKSCHSDNTHKQLADILGWLVNTLNTNQTPSSNTNSREAKAYIPNTFNSIKLDKLNNFLFQCCLYFCTNSVQFNIDIVKINFTMTYLTEVTQD